MQPAAGVAGHRNPDAYGRVGERGAAGWMKTEQTLSTALTMWPVIIRIHSKLANRLRSGLAAILTRAPAQPSHDIGRSQGVLRCVRIT